MPHGQSGQSLDFRHSPRSHPISLRPASNAAFLTNSDALYARSAGKVETLYELEINVAHNDHQAWVHQLERQSTSDVEQVELVTVAGVEMSNVM